MKKFMRGLMGETRNLLDGRGELTLSNLQYYENLKQALDHLQKDDRYLLFFGILESITHIRDQRTHRILLKGNGHYLMKFTKQI